MYSLLVNSGSREPIDRIPYYILRHEPELVAAVEYANWGVNRYHMLRKVRTPIARFYTPRLRRLVWRCLDPNPANRPSQLELLEKVERGLRLYKRHLRRLERSGKELPELKLFYRGHEINQLPQGAAYKQPDLAEVRNLLRNEFLDPDLPRLRVPVQKYSSLRLSGEDLKSILNPKMHWRKTYNEKPDTTRWFNQPDIDTEDEDGDEDGDDDSDHNDEEDGNEEGAHETSDRPDHNNGHAGLGDDEEEEEDEGDDE